jgi:hypothetical protein
LPSTNFDERNRSVGRRQTLMDSMAAVRGRYAEQEPVARMNHCGQALDMRHKQAGYTEATLAL